MYTIKSFFRLAALSAGLFLSAAGCSEDNPSSPEDGTIEVSLSTRGGVETADYRQWVFGSDNKCVFNQSFGAGSGSVRLKDGTYRFATLPISFRVWKASRCLLPVQRTVSTPRH